MGGYGFIYMLTPPGSRGGQWSQQVLYNFTNGADGAQPVGTLLPGPNGSFYGMNRSFCGQLFQLNPPSSPKGSWTVAALVSFSAGCDTGGPVEPTGGLVSDKAGNLYGMSANGGANNSGTVFELSPPTQTSGEWSVKLLYSFPAGDYPGDALLIDGNGALFGTTLTTFEYGGSVFQLRPPTEAGGPWRFAQLVAFPTDDGSIGKPNCTLILDHEGNLYGEATFGYYSPGAVFELSPPASGSDTWAYTALYSFQGGEADGGEPIGGLSWGTNGTLFGVAELGPNNNSCGMVFSLTPPASGSSEWTETILHNFTGAAGNTDGCSPTGPLIVNSQDHMFASTVTGGNGYGTIFSVEP